MSDALAGTEIGKIDPVAHRAIRFLDIDCLTAAKARIRYLLTTYDHVIVSFSGGKDSTAVLHLVRQVMDEMGMQDRPTVCNFYDEEVIPEVVIDFVQSYHNRPGFKLNYFAYPMLNNCFIMGEHRAYLAWDPAREGNWMRNPPPYAIRQIHPDNLPLDQRDSSTFMMRTLGIKGKVALLNGMRAAESPNRYKSSLLVKSPMNYISTSGGNNIDFCRPIYDWQQFDVFKYFKDADVPYAPIYNSQMWSGVPLRVATPLHDAAHHTLHKWREMYPLFYQQILDIWPDVATTERYWKDVEFDQIIRSYPPSWAGIMQYIDERIHSPGNKARAKLAVDKVRRAKEKNRLRCFNPDQGYGFPLYHVFYMVTIGGYMKGINLCLMPDEKMMEYERMAEAYAEQQAV